jgi:cobalt-zinc-cadmium efflux system outer membrane protein
MTDRESTTRILQGRIWHRLLIAGLLPAAAFAQTAFNWQQIKDKFVAGNPTLKAAQLSIDESRAAEITAYLRPNPDFTGTLDQINPFAKIPSPTGVEVYRPLTNALPYGSLGYLIERGNKRALRRDQARQTTSISESTYLDQERGLVFNLRSAFVQTLQAKAFLQNAQENLAYWDRELAVNRLRFQAGDLAQVDLDTLELQRVQFESDYETALVNLRTAKIQLLMLMNDRTPIDQFDVSGPYDFSEELRPLEEFHNVALDARPDLKAAVQTVELAKITHQLAVANGTTDPTVTFDFARNPPIPVYFGLSVSIPLRIFDRNQGEKARTQLDVSLNERLLDANRALVFSDVDSAYWTLVQNVNLLKPYKAKYLPLAASGLSR